MHTRSPRSFSGVSARFISTGYSLLEPVQNLVLNPSHPVGAKLYPLGELAGRFQPCNVLWRIKNQLLQLPFRQYPHHDLSMIEEHRDARVSTSLPRGVQVRRELGIDATILFNASHTGT